MATKPRVRVRSAALAAITTAIFVFATASPALAFTGGVYFDARANAAAGDPSMLFNQTFTGTDNVGLGRSVMTNLTSGFANTATGSVALFANTTGHNNVATGSAALESNTTGNNNVATGADALLNNTTGTRNVATGSFALGANTTGKANVALGHKAGKNLTTGSNNVDIANGGKAGEAGTIRIGNNTKQTAAFIAGISGTSLGGKAQPVLVKSNGQLGVAPAASAKSSAAKPLSAVAGRRLLATVKRQQRQIERQGKEIRALRAQNG